MKNPLFILCPCRFCNRKRKCQPKTTEEKCRAHFCFICFSNDNGREFCIQKLNASERSVEKMKRTNQKKTKKNECDRRGVTLTTKKHCIAVLCVVKALFVFSDSHLGFCNGFFFCLVWFCVLRAFFVPLTWPRSRPFCAIVTNE